MPFVCVLQWEHSVCSVGALIYNKCQLFKLQSSDLCVLFYVCMCAIYLRPCDPFKYRLTIWASQAIKSTAKPYSLLFCCCLMWSRSSVLGRHTGFSPVMWTGATVLCTVWKWIGIRALKTDSKPSLDLLAVVSGWKWSFGTRRGLEHEHERVCCPGRGGIN